VMKVLKPIWTTKPETAGRVRGRIEAILDWAAASGLRAGANPARWRGHLDKLLPPRSKVRRVKHHAALPFTDLPTFMKTLQEQPGTGARALEFTVLTAARTGETIGATLNEIDFDAKVWTVPGERMKAGKEHRVPLCDRALAILNDMKSEDDADKAPEQFLFAGAKAGRPVSNMTMDAVLRRMKRDDVTVHGFRSTFKDWASEQTAFPNELSEMALAHVVGDKTEAAYRRGDLFEKRRKLMSEWAAFCDQSTKS
jgi:integrase